MCRCVVCVVLFDIQVPHIYGSGKGKSIVQNNQTILFMQEWPWPMPKSLLNGATAPQEPVEIHTYHIKLSIGSSFHLTSHEQY